MKAIYFDKFLTIAVALPLLPAALVSGCFSKQGKILKSTSFVNFTSFQVCDKKPERYALSRHNMFPEDIVKGLPAYYDWKYEDVLQVTSFPVASFSSTNGFVNAVVAAYKGHHNLIIRPDDVWAAIMIQFSFYVNKNAEKLRSKFVDFEGQKQLRVALPGTLRKASYDVFVELITEKIHENFVDAKVKDWVLPNFSTTTANDRISIGVVLMATMKQYFDYSAQLICGIPSIHLAGTVKDWQDIYDRLDKLNEYGLSEWSSKLKPVLKQFVEAKKGTVDLGFWEKICQVEDYREGCTVEQFITGWITVFVYFEPNGNPVDQSNRFWQKWPTVNVRDVPSGHVHVSVKIIDHDSKEYNSTMFAGHLAVQVEENGYSLQPSLGWGIALHSRSSKDYFNENDY